MICTNCYRNDLEPADLYFTRINGHWSALCRKCAPMDSTPPIAGTLDWINPKVAVSPETQRMLDALRINQERDLVQNHQQFNQRRYERYAINLVAEYEAKTGKAAGSALVQNVSRGGIALLARHEFAVGQNYQIRVDSEFSETMKINFSGEVQIMRCRPLQNGEAFEVGGKFASVEGETKNQSSDNTLANIWYQRRTWSALRRARLLDFSDRGISLVVQENLSLNEIIFICMRGNDGLFRNQEIRGVTRVVKVTQVYDEHYTVQTEFIKSKLAK